MSQSDSVFKDAHGSAQKNQFSVVNQLTGKG